MTAVAQVPPRAPLYGRRCRSHDSAPAVSSHPPPQDPPGNIDSAAAPRSLAGDALFPAVYDELRRLARQRLRGPTDSLDATGLVHEAWLKLCGGRPASFRDSAHFFAAAAQAMRHVLVDRVRRARRARRGGGGAAPVELATGEPAVEGLGALDLLALDAALDRLAVDHPRCAEVVQLRFFAGLAQREVAEVLGISDATIERDWRFAKAWLHRAIEGPATEAGGGDA